MEQANERTDKRVAQCLRLPPSVRTMLIPSDGEIPLVRRDYFFTKKIQGEGSCQFGPKVEGRGLKKLIKELFPITT